MIIKVKTKNEFDMEKKPRVYFTCHSEDFEKYFKKVCDDIFKTHDCAIYYTEDMTEIIVEEEKEVVLERMNLFVIPVTFKLLSTPNRAIDEDFSYAMEKHIPILPIIMEQGIDEYYFKSDKLGELQYLNPYSTDFTEISYEEKIKKYLDEVLISDKMAKRVRDAFDAYIFLSYRKKDRKYANELMRMIHSNPECRDIAIWFDEFLTPGENFNKNIEKVLDSCNLFTLLVTPRLLEKVIGENGVERDNYVISIELPLAQKNKDEKGTDIFAVEMEDTNRELLSIIKISDCVNSKNDSFRSCLLEAISKISINVNHGFEHDFLIGLAYLEGIDVEINREKGIELIQNVANLGFEEAIRTMITSYINGNGVSKSYFHAKDWYEKLIFLKLSNSDLIQGMVELMEVYDQYCDFLSTYFIFEYVNFVNQRMLPQIEQFVNKLACLDSENSVLFFWLCKTYYRVVHANMKRDADNYNAEYYGKLIESKVSLITNENQRSEIEKYLYFIQESGCFWNKIDFIINSSINETVKKTEYSIENILNRISICNREYTNDSSKENLEELVYAYEVAVNFFENLQDAIEYPKYAVTLLRLKEEIFISEPEILESVDIVMQYDGLVHFLIDLKKTNEAIAVLMQQIHFLEYLLEIGADFYQRDYYDALLLMKKLLEEKTVS